MPVLPSISVRPMLVNFITYSAFFQQKHFFSGFMLHLIKYVKVYKNPHLGDKINDTGFYHP